MDEARAPKVAALVTALTSNEVLDVQRAEEVAPKLVNYGIDTFADLGECEDEDTLRSTLTAAELAPFTVTKMMRTLVKAFQW